MGTIGFHIELADLLLTLCFVIRNHYEMGSHDSGGGILIYVPTRIDVIQT